MIDKDKRPLQEFSCKLKKCWNSVQALTQKSEKTHSFCSQKTLSRIIFQSDTTFELQ